MQYYSLILIVCFHNFVVTPMNNTTPDLFVSYCVLYILMLFNFTSSCSAMALLFIAHINEFLHDYAVVKSRCLCFADQPGLHLHPKWPYHCTQLFWFMMFQTHITLESLTFIFTGETLTTLHLLGNFQALAYTWLFSSWWNWKRKLCFSEMYYFFSSLKFHKL